MTLIVLGNACLDVTHRVDRLPRPGETINALAVAEDLGGKGLNQAIAARRAGADVRLVAPVGDDGVAALVRQRLEAEGIPVTDLVVQPGTSDRSTIMVDHHGENIILTAGARARELRFADVNARLTASPGDALVLQGNLSPELTRDAAETFRRAGARVILNLAPFQEALRAVSPLVDVLVLNAAEATALSGTDDVKYWPDRLEVPLAVITLGTDGCVLISSGRKPSRIPAPAVEAVDTVGAGDTFVGTFAAEWLATGDPYRAARLAIAAASEKVTRTGTVSALPHRADIERLRRRIVEKLDDPS